jgi:transglutaminase-like putative cysteine protease
MSGWQLVRERARTSDTAVGALAVLLSALCLIPLFTNLTWVAPTVVMIAVIAVIGAVTRGLGMPIPFVPVTEAVGLLLTVTTMYAAPQAWARIIPTTPAWDALRALLQQGLQDAQTFAAPVTPFPGLVLLAVAGVGLVALATDTLFNSVRAPVLAGLPLLALYLSPALMLAGGTPWWAFPLPAIGWLLILAADQRDRVRRWGGSAAAIPLSGLSARARRTGAVVILAAGLLAIVLPGRAVPVWHSGVGAGSGTSEAGGTVILDPLVSMRRDLLQASDTEVLSYRTTTTEPSYLRVSVLEDFDGATWQARTGLGTGRDGGVPLPGPVGDVAASDSAGTAVVYDITVTSLANTYLPMPFPVAGVDDLSGLGTDWRMDPDTGIAFSQQTPAKGVSYRVAALDPGIDSGQLRDASAPTGGLWPQLSLPGGISPQIATLAAEVTAAASSPYDKAVALQRWFTKDGGFTYSTSVRSGAGADYIAEFLTDRVGYCEQFAGAMATMARTLGIPSRVVVGFTQGAPDAGDTWHVTVRDAHAWPELWFDGVGWARFEPTPQSGGTVLTPAYARTPGSDTSPGQDPSRGVLEGEGFDAGTPGQPAGPTLPVGAIAVAVTALGLALLSIPLARRWTRRHRRLHARDSAMVAAGAWEEIGDLAIDLGQPWSMASTPRQAAERLSRGMAEPAASAVRRLRREVEQVRYAPSRGTDTGSAERAGAIRADVRAVTRELRGRVRWQTRVAAYCWPSSERRRQRSSIRSMKPGALAEPWEDGVSGVTASAAGWAPKAE